LSIRSDLKYRDTFRDPVWLLDNLLSKYKVIRPTNAGWYTSNSGSGAVGQLPFYIWAGTGTTANSRGLAYAPILTLNSGDYPAAQTDYEKRLELMFMLHRVNSDSEAVARFQLKSVNTEGALSGLGIGLEINNFDIIGEAYGTARGTVSLGSLTPNRICYFRLVHIPNSRVEFWVDGVLAGTLTGDYVPTGQSTSSYLVLSIINGSTGGVNAVVYVHNIILVQER